MLEIPESIVIAHQLNETIYGKKIKSALANTSLHKFAFYSGDPIGYNALLSGQTIGSSVGIGAMIEISADNCRLVFGDGSSLKYYNKSDNAPKKHQLFIKFEDNSALVCSVQMYGTVFAFENGNFENKYYSAAKEKPMPISDDFDIAYFYSLRNAKTDKLSAKAFLATEQRIPGIGNGVLQDILFRSGIHPKRKIATLTKQEYSKLFSSIKEVLAQMIALGGRDTEKDLFGNAGGYKTILSKNTVNTPCPVCGEIIQKAAYMGGAIYWCPKCQPLE